MMAPAEVVRLVEGWYEGAKRDLPWRRSRDPYAIWVSEIMLQQTRVETVGPYYERFLKRFPDVHTLAEAPLEDVLTQWSGLGYYRRARALADAARQVVADFGGRLPERASELMKLAGIGRYTAGAIASIAHGERAPIVDGNVMRVLARLYGNGTDMRSAAGQRWAWQVAEQMVGEAADAGCFNQALMELGATVCTPRAPRCGTCPIAAPCVALREGEVDTLPLLKKKKAPRPWAVTALVLRQDDGALLLGRRLAGGLFGGLWEPPLVDGEGFEQLLASHEFMPAGNVRHVLSHRRMDVTVLSAGVRAAPSARQRGLPAAQPPYEILAWRREEDVPLSTLARKILAEAGR